MKNTIKLFSYLLVLTLTLSCDSNSGDDLGYTPQEERGWIQFPETNLEVIQVVRGMTDIIDLGVDIQVPTTSSDLTINYTLRGISGLDPNTVFSNNGITVAPAGKTSYSGPDNNTGIKYSYLAPVPININELEDVSMIEPMLFDVVLTSTSSSKITAGLTGETLPVTQRILIHPSIVYPFIGTYSVDEGFTSGTYAPLGLTDFFGETYQVELELMPDEDGTGTTILISTSNGFDPYFFPGVELTLQPNGSLYFDDSFDPGNPVIALFRILELTSSSYDFLNGVIQADGALGEFGPYRFTLTKI